jgi:hypothetical protein
MRHRAALYSTGVNILRTSESRKWRRFDLDAREQMQSTVVQAEVN